MFTILKITDNSIKEPFQNRALQIAFCRRYHEYVLNIILEIILKSLYKLNLFIIILAMLESRNGIAYKLMLKDSVYWLNVPTLKFI